MLQKNKEYTYKEICEVLNLERKGGDAKKKQLKELQKYYNYTKNGTKFYINEIISKESFVEKNKRNQTCGNIEHILMTTLSRLDDKQIYFASNKELLLLCYAINNNYYSILNDKFYNSYMVKKHFGFDNSFVEYVEITYDLLRPMLKTCLNSMQSKKEISLNKGYKLVKNNIVFNCVSETEDLGKELFKIQGDAMKELGIKSDRELYGRKIYLIEDYYALCNKKAHELDKNIDKFYQCYAILINTDKIKYDLILEKNELNNKIYNKVHTTKTLRDLTYNQIEQWFNVLHTKNGDEEYEIVDFIKMINSKERK